MRLSHLPGERDLQRYILLALGCLLVGVLAVAVGITPDLLRDPSGSSGDRPLGLVPLRASLGVVISLISLQLPVLVLRHSESIRTIAGLKRQYVTAGVVTAVLGVVVIFFWWTGLGATVVGLVSVLLAARVSTIPAAEMTEQIDHDNPEAWTDASPSLMVRRPLLVFILAVVSAIVLVVVLVGVLFLVYG